MLAEPEETEIQPAQNTSESVNLKVIEKDSPVIIVDICENQHISHESEAGPSSVTVRPSKSPTGSPPRKKSKGNTESQQLLKDGKRHL